MTLFKTNCLTRESMQGKCYKVLITFQFPLSVHIINT